MQFKAPLKGVPVGSVVHVPGVGTGTVKVVKAVYLEPGRFVGASDEVVVCDGSTMNFEVPPVGWPKLVSIGAKVRLLESLTGASGTHAVHYWNGQKFVERDNFRPSSAPAGSIWVVQSFGTSSPPQGLGSDRSYLTLVSLDDPERIITLWGRIRLEVLQVPDKDEPDVLPVVNS